MRIGFVGLGKMGMNMVTRLAGGGHHVVASDTDHSKRAQVEALGAVFADTPVPLCQTLRDDRGTPAVVWVMVPSGEITERVLTYVASLLGPGDILIDGGNSNFRDSMRRAAAFGAKGVRLLDIGTSGGIWGLQVGYCMMAGGDQAAFKVVEPALATLAPPQGYLYCGPSGSGHYSKMVHNAIEYGMMQAYGEGFALLESAGPALGYNYDLPALAHLWGQGSVIRSWLLELLTRALKDDPHLKEIAAYVQDSGEGRWAVKEAIDAAVPAPVLTLALQMRFLSRLPDSFAAKIAAALRNQFGGHAVLSRSPEGAAVKTVPEPAKGQG